jgi:hypothetical protein
VGSARDPTIKLSKHYAVAPTYGGLTPNHIIWARVTIYGQFGAACGRSGACDDELRTTLQGEANLRRYLSLLQGVQAYACPPYDAPRKP